MFNQQNKMSRFMVAACVLLSTVSGVAGAKGKPHICFKPGTPATYASTVATQYGYQASGGQEVAAFRLEPRWFSTATQGGGLTQGDPTTLTWSYLADGVFIPSAGPDAGSPSNLQNWLNGLYPGGMPEWHALFEAFFADWEAMTGITFVYEPNDDGASFPDSPGSVGQRGDIRIGAHLIDGNAGILAYNYFPDTGDMVIDSADSFFADKSDNSLRLRNVLAHEVGHGIGLAHSCPVNGSKLMEPFINEGFDGPQFDDRQGAQRLYGDANEHNDLSGTATSLGAAMLGESLLQPNQSIDGAQDADVFRVDLNSPVSSLSMAVLPTTQAAYPAGAEDANCNAGNPTYDPNPVQDLRLELLDGDGTTVLQSQDQNSAGFSEILTDVPLAGPASYFVRVLGDGVDEIQAYELQLDVGIVPPMCPGTPQLSECTAAESSKLLIKQGRKLLWKFKGGVNLQVFGDVSNTHTTALCMYRDEEVIHGATIPTSEDAWKIRPEKQLRYRDRSGSADGVRLLALKLKGFGIKLNANNLPNLPINLNSKLRLQLISSAGACYEAQFAVPLKQNDYRRLKAVTP